MSAPPTPPELEQIRARLAAVDEQIVNVLAERMALARAAGEVKRANGAPTLDPAREAAVVTRASERARTFDLPDEDVRQIFWLIVGMCRRAQAGER